jgi:hypothetical protein
MESEEISESGEQKEAEELEDSRKRKERRTKWGGL